MLILSFNHKKELTEILVNKKIILIFLLITSCSLDNKTGLWSNDKKVDVVDKTKVIKLNKEKNILDNEFNKDLKITLSKKVAKNKNQELQNNNSQYNYDGDIKKSSKFKFKKITNFYQNEPDVIFDKGNIFFFDGNGSIIKFEDSSKLTWKKNYYSKAEKKSKPFLFFNKSKNILIVADNIAKYYALDVNNGKLLWIKNNSSPFNSQIKIHKNKFYIVDLENIIHCYSVKNGKEIWKYKTENFFIKSQKRLSIAIDNDIVYFNNSIGDITALNANNGDFVWQLPTQNSQIYGDSFLLKTSDLVINKNSILFSNNKNEFYSVNKLNGNLNWKQKINSDLRPILIGKTIFTISIEGLLISVNTTNGNIVRAIDVFKNFGDKKRLKVKPKHFIAGTKKIYLTINNGRLMIIDIKTGDIAQVIKIDRNPGSKPFISNKKLYIIKNNSIIRFD